MAGSREKKFEYLVLVAVIGVLFYFLLRALERTQHEVEEATVQAEISALRVELLDRLSHRELVGGALPAGDNPVVWAGRKPPGYLGELDGPPVERGIWYFDRSAGVLVYRFRQGGEARFRLVRAGGRQGAPAVLSGVGLLRLSDENKR